MATFPVPAFEQRLVVRNTFLEVACDKKEPGAEGAQRRRRSFTESYIRTDADFASGARSEARSDADTSTGQQSEEGSTSASFRSRCSTIASEKVHEESEEALEAVADALIASAERLESEAREAKRAAASVRASAALGADAALRTTVMFRNLPKALTQEMVLEVLEADGFSALYDFAYLPVDFKKMVNFGYAVVNFVTHDAAEDAMQRFEGFTAWPVTGRKPCMTVWNIPCQGLASQMERYRNSPLLHPDVAEEFRPMLFSCGLKVAFPPPTKQLKAPPRLPQKNAVLAKKQARKSTTDTAAKD